ncbi:ferrochelatase [Mycobacterium decipiens]|uniref:Coproporphyrin III ferrochelatase n=1 Tax=Mycobacterium decipiens TaxID=1430326 RepID=A0A1X2LUQ6_9MYCO|nr:ferrochelatase [Mycobacterium decipiens]OSC40761.1 ferrochelatase [Mycobacterium decipiens]
MQFDAVLLLSFGGPEGPEQVRPFLENVTRGRGVPAERLDAVAEHYLHFGGVSPINAINRALITELRAALDVPVYFGNRNWEPYVEDTVIAMRDNGVHRAAVFTTSAWSGYSSCTQYVEDIARARVAAGPDAPELVKLRPYFDHPIFVEMFAEAVAEAADTVPAELLGNTRLVFTAHSIPVAADQHWGPHLYSRQVAYAARLVAAAAGYNDYDLTWQSRSGPAQVAWLEPDVADHLGSLTGAGVKAVIVCPIGFVADHIEVVWDLDHELRLQAEAAGIVYARASTPNADPRFARLAAGLIDELRYGREAARVPGLAAVPGCESSINGEPCRPPHCVARVNPARPTAGSH